ncbi:MAG: hypothetical protein JST16_15695, partial [Bdellovibrionales bacterium]|nr:hypothetical protein [Bdellovibrionales bacterium]
MTVRHIKALLVLLVCWVGGWHASVVATPQSLRIDGNIYDALGLPYSGATSIGVKVYSAASGGTLLWTAPSAYTPTAVSGKFSLNLDASVAGPSTLKSVISTAGAASALWFELSYSGVTVRPRMKSRGAAFAISSASADSATGLQGVSVSSASPATNDVLVYNGTLWGPTSASSVVSGSFVSKAGDTMSGALYTTGVNVSGLTASKLVSTDASKNLTSTNTSNLTGAGSVSITNSPAIIGGSAAVISVSTANTSTSGILTSTDWNTFNGLVSSKVNRSGDTMTGNLLVSAAQVTTASNTLAGSTVNFNTGNVQVLSSVGGNTITLTNMRDGGAYTVVL